MACSGSRGFRPRSTLLAAALCLPLAAAGPAFAQTAEEVAASMDPAAMQAMDKMSAYLLTLGAFRITGEASTEQVLMTGQKIQFGGTFDILAKRPNAFKIVTQSDIQHREMYYDGKAFTIFSPRSGYYASFPAASSIGLTIDKARREYGIELPLADCSPGAPTRRCARACRGRWWCGPKRSAIASACTWPSGRRGWTGSSG